LLIDTFEMNILSEAEDFIVSHVGVKVPPMVFVVFEAQILVHAYVGVADKILSPDSARVTHCQRFMLHWTLHVDWAPKADYFHATTHRQTKEPFPNHLGTRANVVLDGVWKSIWW